ncbi:hypothetical protein NIES267_35200 [Calothrix parasitica NIES-267]|uniref:Uncharacterized protein n=1 Tax=Calothrix parasitica NIES-267 TaxID=1973488 RepID=A0A1Z4LS02_9CYAN|nr:hypothetical protein NIES267_35200 [Calothrix parasitica NIES-267]
MPEDNKNIQPPIDSPTQNYSPPEKLPFWRASLVKALRGTIGLLENTAVKLENESSPSSEDKPGFLQKLQQVWTGILGKIRLILPARFSAKLSDTALTGIISGVTIMIFLITSNIFDSKPSQVAIIPPDNEIPAPVSATEAESIELGEQEIPSVIEKTPAQQKETASLPVEEDTIKEDKSEIPAVIESQNTITQQEEVTSLPIEEDEIIIPPVTEEKTISQQEEEITLKTEDEIIIPPVTEEETISQPEETTVPQEELEETSPPRLLTPEETLIAAIQNQVGEISFTSKEDKSGNRTFAGIIESIKANFLNSNLTIKISNEWYRLDKSQQDNLTAQILQRSQELDFTHLEITDLQGKLIARNPVVGTEMIIFKRK